MPPRFCYLVFSHREPVQVERLAVAIRGVSPSSRVVITHDTTSTPPPVVDDPAVTVHDLPGGAPWGSIALVDAVLERFRALEVEGDYDWVAVVSGQDFPLRPLGGWEEDLDATGADALLFPHPMPRRLLFGSRRNGQGLHLARYTHRHIRFPALLGRGGRLRRRCRWLAQRLAANLTPVVNYLPLPGGGSVLGVRRRRTPFGPSLPCRKGSTWFALRRPAVQRVLAADAEHGLRAHYRHTLCPDESLIHTAVRSDPGLEVRLGRLSADIFESPFDPHPMTVTGESLPRLLAVAAESGAPFGRKFAAPEVIDELELRLGLPALR